MKVTVTTPPAAQCDNDVPAEEFIQAFRNYPAGVALITADAGNGPVAMTATSVSSLSASPPMLVFSVSAKSSSAPTIRAAETVVVHLLGADQIELAKLGATSGIDRFAAVDRWTRLVTGEPVFTEAQSWLRGRIITQVDVSGSTLIMLRILETGQSSLNAAPSPVAPLVYHNRTWHRLNESSVI